MECNRTISVFASLAFGAILAAYALDAPAPESPLAGTTARGMGSIINATVGVFGHTGAAVAFVLLGCVMAVVSVLLCPSARR